jgi:hypothetical protein
VHSLVPEYLYSAFTIFSYLIKSPQYSPMNISKLTAVKIIHTLIWTFFNAVFFYLSYAVIFNKIDKLVWFCIGLIILEGIVLLVFKGVCPLTIIARKYSTSKKAHFDIYLPVWLAKYNKVIYTTIFIALIVTLGYRVVAS